MRLSVAVWRLLGAALVSLVVAGPAQAAGNVVISEVYGGGGNSGATLKNDFIELYNRTGSDVDLAGWSVRYASSAGTTWQTTPLSGTIPANGYYLVQEAAGAAGSVDLPTPDAAGSIPMSATAGKVVLVNNNTTFPTGTSCPSVVLGAVDIVGYGGANCFEGAGAAPVLSNTTSDSRAGGGTVDTDNNAADFTAGAPAPRNSGERAPAVASTAPANGATDVPRNGNVDVTFSEPVTTSDSWYSISCSTSGIHTASASGGPTTFTLNPDSDFAGNESCAVTIFGGQVADQDSEDPPDTMAANYSFTFQTAAAFECGDPATPIHEIQGSDPASGKVGQTHTLEGVVVGDYQGTGQFSGYYLQEEDADADSDPATSEGIFVFNTSFAVSRGDLVRIRGTVTEFSGLTELTSVTAFASCGTGRSVTPTSVGLPVASISDHERYEGMLVRYDQTLTAAEVFNLGRFGEVSLSGVGRLYTPTAVVPPGAPAQAKLAENNRSRIILDDANNQQNIDPTLYPQGGLSASNTLRVGDTLPGLTGVMDFRFNNYRIQPVGPLTWDHTNPRTAAPEAVGGNFKVASFNVLNFFNGNGTHQEGLAGGFPTSRGASSLFELNRQLAKEVSALSAMNADVVGLMEIENDAGSASALADLVAALNDAMGAGTYAYIDTGVIGTDEIKVALIYKPAAVTPVGDWKIITSATDPRFIDTRNRPSLAQTFEHTASGEKLTVVVNHLKSKGSACAGDPDLGDGQGNCNITRTQAAAALADWLATDPTDSRDPDFLLIGDMNSYTFEDPIAMFESKGFTNLPRAFHGLTPYSYVFNGESGYLDHALATSSLASQATGVTDWHINPDEPTVLDYNVEFKTANQVNTFYAPTAYRSSDHDPVVIGLDFDIAPTVDAGGPYTVAEGSSVAVTATGADADGDALTYTWDLDNDGTFETGGKTATFTGADGPATKTIRVRVSDGTKTAVDEATVTVNNVAPTATFNAPASSFAGFAFTLSLTNPSDASAADAAAGFTYAFDCGSGYGPFTPSNTAACPTTTSGTRSVGGIIRDKDGGTTEYRDTVDVGATYASLCTLVKAVVTNEGVANGLCAKLDAAAASAARGNDNAKNGQLGAFANQVDAQTGKSISAADAATLKAIAATL